MVSAADSTKERWFFLSNIYLNQHTCHSSLSEAGAELFKRVGPHTIETFNDADEKNR